ncbi:MAG: hypothetical protein H0W62_07280 [Chitinophagales bacterium]|nr:hypothetical protein [Chitinophagales bacterium]
MPKIPLWVPFILLVGILLIHFFFLNADPDINLSLSRDAFTDEGLNTSQLRNYINHGDLDMTECDNLIKTPLFNLLLYIPLKFAGTHLIVARLTVLLIVLTVMFISCRNNYYRTVMVIFCFTTLIQYFVFQYSHFSLSEMMSTCWNFLSVYFLFRLFTIEQKKLFHLLCSVLFSAFSYYTKIQFLYIVLLAPACVSLIYILERKKLLTAENVSRNIFLTVSFTLLFITFYMLCWYLPFNRPFNYMLQNEATDKYAAIAGIPKIMLSNIKNLLLNPQGRLYNALSFITVIFGFFLWKRSVHSQFKILFPLLLVWLLLELHKLTMTYLPSRYLVSYYFVAGLLSSVVIAELIFHLQNEKKFFLSFSRFIGGSLLILFTTINLYELGQLYHRRTYAIRDINNYFSTSFKKNSAIMIGPWAPSLGWESDAITKPVWRNFMNDKNIFNAIHPDVILSEPDEEESNHAYVSQGIRLAEYADSIRSFQVGKWKINAYWIKK